MLVCGKKERRGPDQGLSTASQGSDHVHSMSWHDAHPPPSFLPCLLVQNLSLKRIAPTDNVQAKLHDKYTRHQWLKGYVSGGLSTCWKSTELFLAAFTEHMPVASNS